MYTAFISFLIGFAAASSPGVVQMSVLHNSLSGKKIQSLKLALGCCAMNLVVLMVAYFGLSQFIKIPALYYIIGTIGLMYMLYVGIVSLKSSINQSEAGNLIYKNSFISGTLLCLLSPLTYVYFSGIASALIKYPIVTAAIYSLILNIGVFTSYAIVTLIGNTIAKTNNIKIIRALQIASSIAIIFFALLLFVNLFRS